MRIFDNIDFGTYTHDQYYDDIFRMTQYRSDADLIEVLVTNSFDTAKWMTTHGIDLIPATGRQAFKVDGKFKFWGGLALRINGGGEQLVQTLHDTAEKAGIEVLYEATATDLLYDEDRGVHGVRCRHKGKVLNLESKAVVLACGGFRIETRRCARAISAPAGTSPRCAAPNTTTGKGSTWRSTSAPCPTATGPAATRSPGT